MKRVFILRTSPRKGGNSDILAEAFKQGALSAGHEVDEIRFADYRINYCQGCFGSSSALACQNSGECWQKDDMAGILPRVRQSDVLVFAAPVYFYTLSAQLKTFLDRMVPLYKKDYSFREVYLLATCENAEKSVIRGLVQSVSHWLICFPHANLAGVVYGAGALRPGEIRNAPEQIEKAYNMGQNC